MKRSFQERKPIPIGIAGLLVGVVVLALAFAAGRIPALGGGRTYVASFSEAAGLRKDDPVRIAGVQVGKVTSVTLEDAHVRVEFALENDKAHLGRQTRAAIKIETLLGSKALALQPDGSGTLKPGEVIPLSRTTAPFQVVPAFEKLTKQVQSIDTKKLAKAFNTISKTFKNSPDEVQGALRGLTRLSQTIASRDEQLNKLLSRAEKVSGVLAERNQEFTKLLEDADLLLKEVRARRAVIHQLLINTVKLSQQLTGMIDENEEQIGPALEHLSGVVDVLVRNQRNLSRALQLLAPFVTVFSDALGNGRWFDIYLQNLVPLPASVKFPSKNSTAPLYPFLEQKGGQ